MSDRVWYFDNGVTTWAVTLPLDFHEAIDDWTQLRSRMIRQVPEAFTRDEWAYLLTFLEQDNLSSAFRESFGNEVEEPGSNVTRLYRPRGPIAVWLPNNVSLLGPLTLVLLSLTGQRIALKPGSAAKDLAGEFLDFAVANLRPGALKDYLATEVQATQIEREDSRQADLARDSRVRVVFGSDRAAKEIHALPHPLDSAGFSFTDRKSEAWIEMDALDDEVLATLVKVFAIYGQAGCTSPRRVVLIDGKADDPPALAKRLRDLWPEVIRQDPPMHIASANVLAAQHARALGWETETVARNAAVLAHGPPGLPDFDAPMTLCIQAASREEALAALPQNIQTVGHVLNDPEDPGWLRLLAASKVLRFVPLGQVHFFNNSWDGQDFWRQCFESMEVRP